MSRRFVTNVDPSPLPPGINGPGPDDGLQPPFMDYHDTPTTNTSDLSPVLSPFDGFDSGVPDVPTQSQPPENRSQEGYVGHPSLVVNGHPGPDDGLETPWMDFSDV